jgi:LemA protein
MDTGFYIAGGILLALFLVAAGIYNGFVRLRNQVGEAFATMDVYLKRRYDVIPNLVEIVKGYAAHERDTLERVVQARNMAANAENLEERSKGDTMLSGTLKSLFALSENYPTLKADGAFINLQKQLAEVENDILQSRKYYNGVVRAMNTRVETFPANMLAKAMGFGRATFFMADEGERENVRISL